jgi:hypothetical protein
MIIQGKVRYINNNDLKDHNFIKKLKNHKKSNYKLKL